MENSAAMSFVTMGCRCVLFSTVHGLLRGQAFDSLWASGSVPGIGQSLDIEEKGILEDGESSD